MNYFEVEVLGELRDFIGCGAITVDPESGAVFRAIESMFPVKFSRIDWSRVPGAIGLSSVAGPALPDEFGLFFRDVVGQMHLDGSLTYVGDSATDLALVGSVEVMSQVLDRLIAIPQHHFFFSDSGRWCFSCTFEGDMHFGYSPRGAG